MLRKCILIVLFITLAVTVIFPIANVVKEAEAARNHQHVITLWYEFVTPNGEFCSSQYGGTLTFTVTHQNHTGTQTHYASAFFRIQANCTPASTA